jgi:hypothetical protein
MFSLHIDEVNIQQLNPSNYYEAQVLAGLPNWSGKQIKSYNLPQNFDTSQ